MLHGCRIMVRKEENRMNTENERITVTFYTGKENCFQLSSAALKIGRGETNDTCKNQSETALIQPFLEYFLIINKK